MRFKNYWIAAAYFLISWGSLSAYDNSWLLNTDLYLANGYRQDCISTLICSHNSHDNITACNDLQARNISLYQLGFKCKWALCQYFFRLEADYGWSNQGKYREAIGIPGGSSTDIQGGLHSGISRDCIFGGGYQYCFGDCLCIGPVVGWSYQHLQFASNHTKFFNESSSSSGSDSSGFSDNSSFPLYHHFRYINRWQGPWLGLDATFRIFRLTVNTGYEYHWAHWHASFGSHNSDPLGQSYSNKLRSNQAYGQVVYLYSRWNFCSYWYAGIGLKAQDWRVPKGHGKLDGVSFHKVDKVKHVNWHSFAISFDIGSSF